MIPDKNVFYKVDIVVIGAGQAGLSAAYNLQREAIKLELIEFLEL